MRAMRPMLAFALSVICSAAEVTIPAEEYRERRDALRRSLPDGVTVLFGRAAGEVDELRTKFFQEPNFHYLTGWQEPGAILLVVPAGGDSFPDELLFLPPREPERERYTGRRASAEDEDIGQRAGFQHVLPANSFESKLLRALEHFPKIYTPAGRPAEEKLRAMLPLRDVADASAAIGKLRLKKSAREIMLIQRSIDVTIEAHLASWKRLRPSLYEYQVAAAIVGTILELGCERAAYAPIVASGPNATVLHYSENTRRMDRGELLLIDAGAECSGYAADITRTVPVNGKFTPRQRELYDAVLGAQEAVIAAVKPGMSLEWHSPDSLTRLARDFLDSYGKEHLGMPLGEYFTHRVGHHVGLEVHDSGDLLTYGPLEPGMVITVEPGLYLPEEGIGIRIEDMVLVTEEGARVLSTSLPRQPGAIERALAR